MFRATKGSSSGESVESIQSVVYVTLCTLQTNIKLELCVMFVIHKDCNKMHGQQNLKRTYVFTLLHNVVDARSNSKVHTVWELSCR